MKCKKIQEIIFTDYIDNELGEKERAAIDGHLAVCKECRLVRESLEAVVRPFRDSETALPPDALWGRIHAALQREDAPADYVGINDFLSIFRQKWVSAAAMVSILALTLFAGIFISGDVLNRQQAKAVEIADNLELGVFNDIPGVQTEQVYSKYLGG
jgi:predicted anti-sigma-YlaC factor YlaD